MNAHVNNVHINITDDKIISTKTIGTAGNWNVILLGDMFYENPLAGKLTKWLHLEKEAGKLIYIGDPGRYLFDCAKNEPDTSLQFLKRYKLGIKGYELQGYYDTAVYKVFDI